MNSLKLCILVVMIVIVVSVFMGCNQHSNTLASVAVAPADQIMTKGTTRQFTAIGTFSNSMSLTWTQVVVWSSSNTAVATVSNTAGSNGLVTSVDYGTAIITAYDVANNISGTAIVTVANPDSLTILPDSPSMAVGTTHQFTAVAVFSGGTVTQVITSFATWSVLSSGIASIADSPGVYGNGIVTTGSIPGTAVIQAEDTISGVTGTTTLTVTSTPLASIEVSPAGPVISLSTTTQQQFSAIGTFQDGSKTPSMTTAWAWSSSNTAVATVDYYTGLAHAVAAGTATITAKDPITGVSGSTTLNLQ